MHLPTDGLVRSAAASPLEPPSRRRGAKARRLVRGWSPARWLAPQALVLVGGCQVGLADLGFHSIAGKHDVRTPTAVATHQRFTRLAVGDGHACAVTAAGQVFCRGSNAYQQLGSSSALELCDEGATPCSPAPIAVEGAPPLIGIGASLRFSCGVTDAGVAWCWGYGEGGQLGNGLATSSATPVAVTIPEPLAHIALGGSGLIACGVGASGTGDCWGPGGTYGGLGDGTTGGSDTPVAVAGDLQFTEIGVGDDHACGLTPAGVAYCWGSDSDGKLGTGPDGTASSMPTPVAGGLVFALIRAGSEHSCALTADGRAYCWGIPALVGSVTASNVTAPLEVAGAHRFTALSAGLNATCALDAAAQAWCWGLNYGGELGDGTLDDHAEPALVQSATRFVALGAGGSPCALDASGQAWCWGANADGQVGSPP